MGITSSGSQMCLNQTLSLRGRQMVKRLSLRALEVEKVDIWVMDANGKGEPEKLTKEAHWNRSADWFDPALAHAVFRFTC